MTELCSALLGHTRTHCQALGRRSQLQNQPRWDGMGLLTFTPALRVFFTLSKCSEGVIHQGLLHCVFIKLPIELWLLGTHEPHQSCSSSSPSLSVAWQQGEHITIHPCSPAFTFPQTRIVQLSQDQALCKQHHTLRLAPPHKNLCWDAS